MKISNPESLPDLLERVIEAKGPDRELDQDIFCELGFAPAAPDGTLMAYLAPRFTEDASLLAKYVQELFPGAHMVEWPAEAGTAVEMTFPHQPGETHWGTAPSPPRAFLACLIEALISWYEQGASQKAKSM